MSGCEGERGWWLRLIEFCKAAGARSGTDYLKGKAVDGGSEFATTYFTTVH